MQISKVSAQPLHGVHHRGLMWSPKTASSIARWVSWRLTRRGQGMIVTELKNMLFCNIIIFFHCEFFTSFIVNFLASWTWPYFFSCLKLCPKHCVPTDAIEFYQGMKPDQTRSFPILSSWNFLYYKNDWFSFLASSSVQNIVFRLTAAHDLNFVFGKNRNFLGSNKSKPFRSENTFT